MQKGPVTGWTPLFPDLPTPPLRPGISLQALGTFWGYHRTNLQQMRAAYEEAVLAQLGIALDVVQQLGIPLDADYYHIPLDAPLGWTGYRLEIDGTRVEDRAPPEATVFIDYLNPAGPVHILAWRRRVIYQPTQEWAEIQWDPIHGDRFFVHQETATRTLADATQAHEALYRGWQLLRRVGRTKGTGKYPDSATFRETLTRVLQHLKRAQIPLSQPNVAERLGHTERHIRRLFAQHVTTPHGENWAAFTKKI
jgi:hypothetical protein